jgi:hypothetical protein
VHFNIKNGSSALTTIFLMIVIISVSAFGFLILVSSWDASKVNASTDVNLTGITTSGDIYNGTNLTVHGLASVMPNFIWIVIIFLLVVFITLLAIALKKH